MPTLLDPSSLLEESRGASRETLVEIGYSFPPGMKDVSDVPTMTLEQELARLTGLLSQGYKALDAQDRITETTTGQMELDIDEATVVKTSRRPICSPTRPPRSRLRTARQRAQADSGADRKPFPYGTKDPF